MELNNSNLILVDVYCGKLLEGSIYVFKDCESGMVLSYNDSHDDYDPIKSIILNKLLIKSCEYVTDKVIDNVTIINGTRTNVRGCSETTHNVFGNSSRIPMIKLIYNDGTIYHLVDKWNKDINEFYKILS